MTKFAVLTEGPRSTRLLLKSVHDVDRYVAQVRSRGSRTVLVGSEEGELRPYDEWRMAVAEPVLGSALHAASSKRTA